MNDIITGIANALKELDYSFIIGFVTSAWLVKGFISRLAVPNTIILKQLVQLVQKISTGALTFIFGVLYTYVWVKVGGVIEMKKVLVSLTVGMGAYAAILKYILGWVNKALRWADARIMRA